jgi:phosphatidylglycerophosphatase B
MGGIFYFATIDKRFIYTGLSGVLLLAAIVWLLPVPFIATGHNSTLTAVSYWVTQSAGWLGTLMLIMGAGYCYAIRYSSPKDKLLSFVRSVVTLVVFLGVFAFINERVTKPIRKAVRPSHHYLLTETGMLNTLDSVYLLSKEDRMLFFKALAAEHPGKFSGIDAQVLEHWVAEAGYSFPSGHTFNAFMLATIFAFSLYKAGREKLHKYVAVPFIWAVLVGVSRVALGVHSPMDVCVGALLGLLVSGIFLYFDRSRRWIIHKRKEAQT